MWTGFLEGGEGATLGSLPHTQQHAPHLAISTHIRVPIATLDSIQSEIQISISPLVQS